VDIPADAVGFHLTLDATAQAGILTAAAAGTVSAAAGAVVTNATVSADGVNIVGSGTFTKITVTADVKTPGTISATTTATIVNNSAVAVSGSG
jgi:hypothetical protein